MQASVIFDMDGTLFQTHTILEPSLEDTFDYLRSRQEWSGDTPIQTYREIMGVPLPVVWETLMPAHSPAIREAANRYFHERLMANIRSGKGALYPHAEELFDFLKQSGYALFIASNGQIEYLQAIVEVYKLDAWVTETFSIQHIETLDKADLVRHIMEKYGIRSGAVIGDRLSDIHAAKRNGLLAIGCRFDLPRSTSWSRRMRLLRRI